MLSRVLCVLRVSCFPRLINGAFSDATPLTFFNSSSRNSSAYPVYVHVGLLPAEETLSASGIQTLAFLPSYCEADHEQCTVEQHTINRHLVVWKALRMVLADFLDLAASKEGLDGYLPLGKVKLRAADPECDAYAVLLFWLGGASPA